MRRIFAMKVSRSTFREMQNVILNCVNQNKDLANLLFETLLTGQVKDEVTSSKHRAILEDVIKHFTIPARLAKEVAERGEFINIVTSDLVFQEDQFAFLNRLRRIDGEEFTFLSDPQNTVHLLNHFISRLQELEKNPKTKNGLEKYKQELHTLGERLQVLGR